MNPLCFQLRTLGCKINQYESQALREAWLEAGLDEVQAPEAASLVVFNSCAVTSKAVQDLRTQVRQTHRANPEAAIVITGCAAQVFAPELHTLPGVRTVIPQASKAGLLTNPTGDFTATATHTRIYPDLHISGNRNTCSTRSRAICKVQDGCSQGCSYCIVPLTRGPAVSREPRDVLDELQRLLAAGYREISLGGINLNQYGRGRSTDFWDLLAMVDTELSPEWHGRARLRISSLDPAQLNAKGLETLAASRMVAPHLHVSLQSLTPDVLVAMGRRATDPEAVFSFLEQLGPVWPRFALGADLLAGFPGETDEHAAQTLEQARRLPLSYAHVFPYSRRPGTRAAKLPNQVHGPVATARAAALRELANGKAAAFVHGVVLDAPWLDVVVERVDDDGTWRGTCQYYLTCQGQELPQGVRERGLVRVRPLGEDGTTVLVQP